VSEDDTLDESPTDELQRLESSADEQPVWPSKDELRGEFQASRSRHLAGSLAWADYGLELTLICERCPDAECGDACAGSVTLDAKLRGPQRLQAGVTNEIRDLEKALAGYFDV
jgi:hypothetical protein